MLRPYKCPVCEGRGKVTGGFYNHTGNKWISSVATEKCKACNGKGIIWSSEDVKTGVE